MRELMAERKTHDHGAAEHPAEAPHKAVSAAEASPKTASAPATPHKASPMTACEISGMYIAQMLAIEWSVAAHHKILENLRRCASVADFTLVGSSAGDRHLCAVVQIGKLGDQLLEVAEFMPGIRSFLIENRKWIYVRLIDNIKVERGIHHTQWLDRILTLRELGILPPIRCIPMLVDGGDKQMLIIDAFEWAFKTASGQYAYVPPDVELKFERVRKMLIADGLD